MTNRRDTMTNRRAQAVEDFQSSHTAQETLYTLLDMHNTMKDILRCLPTRPVDGGTPALHDPDMVERETAPAADQDEALAEVLCNVDAGDDGLSWDEATGSRDSYRRLARAAREHIAREGGAS